MAVDNITLVKAARELLRWNQMHLAVRAAVSIISVRRYESGVAVGDDVVEALFEALRRAGVRFLKDVRIEGIVAAGGVVLRRGARPEPRTPNYKPKSAPVEGKRSPGRPKKVRNEAEIVKARIVATGLSAMDAKTRIVLAAAEVPLPATRPSGPKPKVGLDPLRDTKAPRLKRRRP